MTKAPVSIKINEQENVSGILSVPDGYRRGEDRAVIISHGAGNDMDNPLIVHLADGLAAAGCLTLRFNFLYREKGGKSPDSQAVLIQAWQGAYRYISEHQDHGAGRIIAAGKSMGGRIAAQMTADGILPAERLVFFGYPLHGPGKQDQPRDAHLYAITIPMLFFAGTRDALCDLGTLQKVLRRLEGSWDLEVIEGGDHSFDLPKSDAVPPEKVYDRILNKTVEWLRA
jgi:predicted alpha/beta-hydrolase family hydrolase